MAKGNSKDLTKAVRSFYGKPCHLASLEANDPNYCFRKCMLFPRFGDAIKTYSVKFLSKVGWFVHDSLEFLQLYATLPK